MIVHEIHDLTNYRVTKMLVKEFSQVTDEKIIKNYHPKYKTDPANIFFILKHGRFKSGIGKYFVVEDNKTFICSAGWNSYGNIALILTRAYVAPKRRTEYLLGKIILPIILKETLSYEKVWITCNDYNKAIYDSVKRMNLNKSTSIHRSWPEIYSKFKPAGKKIVNGVDQYILEAINSN